MRKEDEHFSITNKAKGTVPNVPFAHMKEAILGTDYELGLVFVDSKTSRVLNRTYRSIDKPTDILSFPLNESTGEIFIDLAEAEKERRAFGKELENFIGFLFIHGLVHLKGYEHGSRMEHEEQKFRSAFGI